jgi:hypothetical protein
MQSDMHFAIKLQIKWHISFAVLLKHSHFTKKRFTLALAAAFAIAQVPAGFLSFSSVTILFICRFCSLTCHEFPLLDGVIWTA